MRSADELAQFVHDALIAGRSRPEISEALVNAGWSGKEVDEALNAYAEGSFTPPVPRPRPYVSAKDVFLYGLMFVFLGASAISLNNLLFSLINIWIPEPGDLGASEEYETIRWSVSTLVFTAPLFVWISFITNREVETDSGKRRSAIRKILTYLTLFIAALFILGDMVTLVYFLLSGETTLRFLLEVLSVGSIAGGIFGYYLHDASVDEKTGTPKP